MNEGGVRVVESVATLPASRRRGVRRALVRDDVAMLATGLGAERAVLSGEVANHEGRAVGNGSVPRDR